MVYSETSNRHSASRVPNRRTETSRVPSATAFPQPNHSRTTSDIAGASLWFKFQNLQFKAMFKERRALNRFSALPVDQRRRGDIAASAGNHAPGVAYPVASLF